jgi:mannose-6-phosphate isomerase-like protein (cupin superfamily)
MITKIDFENILTSHYFFENRLIYFIRDGKDSVVNDLFPTFDAYVKSLVTERDQSTTIKVQGIETYNKQILDHCYKLTQIWNKPVDCHAYFGYGGFGSFDIHTDPCEVCIYICEGSKQLTIDGEERLLNTGEHIYIKKDTPHKAFNTEDCLSLSFGSYDFSKTKIMDIGFKL